MVRNGFNNFQNKKGFTGYRIRPTYLERLNNYLQGVESNHPQDQTQEHVEEHPEFEQEEQKYNTYSNRQSTNYATNRYNQQPQQQPHQQPQQQVQSSQQPQQQRRPVSSSDLRNKRTNVMNGSYQYGGGSRPARRGATYGIKPSYSSGAFQTDGL